MEGHLLDLPFKGSRNYLHSTDIYPALVELVREQIGSDAWVSSLCLRRPFRNRILASFENSDAATGSFGIRNESNTITGSLTETRMPVTRRIPFDSSVVTASALLGSDSAEILHPSPGLTPLETFMGLMKLLANEVNPGQWWLCQINLDALISHAYPLKVHVSRNVEGEFLVFQLIQAGSRIGSARSMFDRGTFLSPAML